MPHESENPKVVTISGIFGEARDFFASIERMKIGFVHGYRTTISMLDISSLPIAEKERLLQSAANADNMLDNILQKHVRNYWSKTVVVQRDAQSLFL